MKTKMTYKTMVMILAMLISVAAFGQNSKSDRLVKAIDKKAMHRIERLTNKLPKLDMRTIQPAFAAINSADTSVINHVFALYMDSTSAFIPNFDVKLMNYAAKNNFIDQLKFMHSHYNLGIDQAKYSDIFDSNVGISTIHYAAIQADIALLQYLVENGANINAIDYETGNTALHKAIEAENNHAAMYLIQNDAKLTVSNNFGFTPLLLATKLNNTSIAKLLINKGVDFTVRSHIGQSVMDFVVKHNNAGIAKLLMIKGLYKQATQIMSDSANMKSDVAQIIAYYTKSQFDLLQENNLPDLFRRIYEGTIDFDYVDMAGKTLLHYAAIRNDITLLKSAIAKTTDLKQKDYLAKSAYDYAVEYQHEKVIYLLEFAGAKTVQKTNYLQKTMLVLHDFVKLYDIAKEALLSGLKADDGKMPTLPRHTKVVLATSVKNSDTADDNEFDFAKMNNQCDDFAKMLHANSKTKNDNDLQDNRLDYKQVITGLSTNGHASAFAPVVYQFENTVNLYNKMSANELFKTALTVAHKKAKHDESPELLFLQQQQTQNRVIQ